MDEVKAENQEAASGSDSVLQGEGDRPALAPMTTSEVHAKYDKLICEECVGAGRELDELCIACQGTGYHPRVGHPAAREIARLKNMIEAFVFLDTDPLSSWDKWEDAVEELYKETGRPFNRA
jgi:hypothetical protein